MRKRFAVAAIAAVLITGCDRGKSDNAQTSGASPSSSAASTVAGGFTIPSLPNLATPQTAGKPTFQLKLGQPASFSKGGFTITVTPKTLEPVDGVPSRLESDPHNCGSWWKLVEEITVDAQPNSTWKGWFADYVGLSALQSDKKASSSYGGSYGDTYMNGSGTNVDDSEAKFLVKAEKEYESNQKGAFHQSGTVVEYPATCVYDSKADKDVPSGKPPVGLVWNQKLEKGQDADERPDVAVWLL